MWKAFSHLILKNRFYLLGAIALLTGWMAYKASTIKIAYNDLKVLPGADSASIYYAHFKTQFGEDGTVMVLGVETKKMYSLSFLQSWGELSQKIRQLPGITNALCITNLLVLKKDTTHQKFVVERIEPQHLHSQPDADRLWNSVRKLPFYSGFIVNQQETSTLMAVSFEQRMLNDKIRLKVVNQIVELAHSFATKNQVRVHFSGLPYTRSKISEMVVNEFILFLAISICITAILLLILYKNGYSVVFPILIVVLGVLWSLGIMVSLGFRITLLTAIIPPIIVVIGVPNSILLLNKYRMEYFRIGEKMTALALATETIGFTIFIANITTAIGFGVFYFTGSQLLIEFGIVAFLSILCTYLLSIVLIPIIFSFLPPPRPVKAYQKPTFTLHHLLGIFSFWVQQRRGWIYGLSALILVVGMIGISKIKVNGYVVDDLGKHDPVYEDLKFFESQFIGILPFEISVDTHRKNGAENLGVLERIDSLEKIVTRFPAFSKAVSINQLIKYSTQALYNGNPQHYQLPTREEAGFIARYVSPGLKQPGVLRSYIDSTKQTLRVSFQMADIGSEQMNKLILVLKPKVDSLFPPRKFTVHLTGTSILFIKGTNYLVQNLFQSLALAIGLISIIMIALFKTPKMVLISLLPNIIPLILTAGIMGYAGINLKPTTILIFSIAFGLASDQTIYFLTKYRSDKKGLDQSGDSYSVGSLVERVMHETGISMIYTAIILFFGFSIFDGSHFGGTISLGILVSLTMLFAILSNILLLPSLMISLLSSHENKQKV